MGFLQIYFQESCQQEQTMWQGGLRQWESWVKQLVLWFQKSKWLQAPYFHPQALALNCLAYVSNEVNLSVGYVLSSGSDGH